MQVTGLAVVDNEAGNHVVGVISIRDINRLRKQVSPACLMAAAEQQRIVQNQPAALPRPLPPSQHLRNTPNRLPACRVSA